MLSEFDAQFGATRLTTTVNVVSLGLLDWGCIEEVQGDHGGAHVAFVVLLVIANLSWVGWIASRFRPQLLLVGSSCSVMALTGGALAAFAGYALIFVGVASLSATLRLRACAAAPLVLAGPAALLIASAASGSLHAPTFGGISASFAGAILGSTRRQATERAAQQAEIGIEAARGDAEQARAELLSERNHLARELHDVLAHTLSALSIQLEALDSIMGTSVSPEVREQLDSTKQLVREGLNEARGAVRALREDAGSLESQLARLATERRVPLSVEGETRVVPPEVALAVYRVAQEALTNVVKHASGAPAQMHLAFRSDALVLAVENGPGGLPSSLNGLAQSGGGHGLEGIEERIALIGGTVKAGPSAGGWIVHAEVPT